MTFPFVLSQDVVLLLLRVAVGAVFLGHGFLKRGLWKSKEKQPQGGLFKLLSVCEPLGGLALVLGFLTPWAALGLGIIMLGALYHNIFVWKKPFSAVPSGWEFDAVLLAVLVGLLSLGAGAYSLDALLFVA